MHAIRQHPWKTFYSVTFKACCYFLVIAGKFSVNAPNALLVVADEPLKMVSDFAHIEEFVLPVWISRREWASEVQTAAETTLGLLLKQAPAPQRQLMQSSAVWHG